MINQAALDLQPWAPECLASFVVKKQTFKRYWSGGQQIIISGIPSISHLLLICLCNSVGLHEGCGTSPHLTFKTHPICYCFACARFRVALVPPSPTRWCDLAREAGYPMFWFVKPFAGIYSAHACSSKSVKPRITQKISSKTVGKTPHMVLTTISFCSHLCP